MSGLATGIGEDSDVGPAEAGLLGAEPVVTDPHIRAGWLARVRKLVGERMSYALGDQVAYSAGNVVVAALISRHCTQWEFGIYILTQRALDVCWQFCNVFFWAPFVFNLPKTPEERRGQYLGSIMLHQVVACVLAGLAMWGLKSWAHTPQRGIYNGVFAPLILTAAGLMFREFTRRMYFAQMRFKEAFWTDVVTNSLQIAGVWWLFKTHRLNVPNTLWALSLGATTVALWWVAREWKRVSLSVSAAVEDLAMNFRLGRWFFGSNMVFTVSSQCNPWLLSAMVGADSVGGYSKCEAVVNIPRVALVSLQNVMAPSMARAFAEGGKPALAAVVKKMDRMLLIGSIVCAVGIVALGPWVAQTIYHYAPKDARFILIMLALNFVAYAAPLAQTYGLTAINKAGLTFYANLCGLATQVVTSVWLVHRLHIPGAATAMLIGSVTVAVVRGVFYAREMRAPEMTTAA